MITNWWKAVWGLLMGPSMKPLRVRKEWYPLPETDYSHTFNPRAHR